MMTQVLMIDLGLPSGTLWADRNIGASAPEALGDYFRWGETVPFTEDSDNYEYRDLGENIAGTKYDAATVNLGGTYKMPTHKQQKELLKCCTWEWTTLNGVKGIKVIGPNGNHIFFPASGYRCSSGGSLYFVGSNGYYWSATADDASYGRYLYFYSSNWGWNYNFRYHGFPVRAIQNNNIKNNKKIMNDEQKYNQALERAKKVVNNPKNEYGLFCSNLVASNLLAEIFPELKENKDERIRKAIINHFKGYYGFPKLDEFPIEEIFTWLEKQKPYHPVPQKEATGVLKELLDEENKKMLEFTLINLTELQDRFGDEYGRVGECIDWLESLKQRITNQL